MTETKTEKRTIEKVTQEFGDAYKNADDWVKFKGKLQTEFFQLATESLSKRSLPSKLVLLPEEMEQSPSSVIDDWVHKHHPGWDLVLQRGCELHLKRNPSLMKFTFINPDDGMVYGRTTSGGKEYLDEESLKANNPDLYDKLAKWDPLYWSIVHRVIQKYLSWNGGPGGLPLLPIEIDRMTESHLESIDAPRYIPLDDVIEEYAEELQPYLVPSPITVRLVPPRKAKPEDLEEEDECE